MVINVNKTAADTCKMLGYVERHTVTVDDAAMFLIGFMRCFSRTYEFTADLSVEEIYFKKIVRCGRPEGSLITCWKHLKTGECFFGACNCSSRKLGIESRTNERLLHQNCVDYISLFASSTFHISKKCFSSYF